MARPLQLNEWWPFLLCMEKRVQQYGNNPHAVASELVNECGYKMPGHGSVQSKLKMLEERHREHRDKLKAELGPVPRTFKLAIAVTTPQKATLARRWLTKVASVVKNTMMTSG